MRKEEFEAGYCERSGITREYFREHWVSLPCACEQDDCQGWAVVFLQEHMLLHHLWFDLPDKERLRAMELEALRAKDTARATS